MSHYAFFCLDCNREFTTTMHISDFQKSGVTCPQCGGARVTQKVEAFSAVTSKKS